VRNGGEYLKQCVDSVLAQSLDNFEIAVLDNCSCDGSVQWLTGLDDPRIKIYPAATPLSIQDNWARALEVPKHEFMTLLSHDDVLDPNYLEVMDRLIRDNPDAGLYQAHFRLIDEEGRVLRPCIPMPFRETAAEFLTARCNWQRDTFGTGYMMRSSDYDAVGGIPNFEKLLFADDALWLLLMRGSWKATAAETCFSYRMHTQSASHQAGWQSRLRSITQFLEFMEEYKKQDPAVERAFREGFSCFQHHCQHIRASYSFLLVQATKQNVRLESPTAREAVVELSHVQPSLAKEIDNWKIRVREFINRNPVARFIYNAYILIRHGEWRGRRVRPRRRAA
jgi:glycosyltransferase involved in cell wall biosynthesis